MGRNGTPVDAWGYTSLCAFGGPTHFSTSTHTSFDLVPPALPLPPKRPPVAKDHAASKATKEWGKKKKF
jgi:hypothetical protein